MDLSVIQMFVTQLLSVKVFFVEKDEQKNLSKTKVICRGRNSTFLIERRNHVACPNVEHMGSKKVITFVFGKI